MSFYYANARQPEIIRTVQKDLTFSDAIGQQLTDITRTISPHHWLKYQQLFRMFGELMYHGFTSYNNLQTLGEEYTGIIQIDSKFIALPNKLIQFTAIILEFGGDFMLQKLLNIVQRDIERIDELRPEAKTTLLRVCTLIRTLVPYIKAMHRSFFYINGRSYQLSKRLLGINYVRVRYWLDADYSISGYRTLGLITMLQVALVFMATLKQQWRLMSIAASATTQKATKTKVTSPQQTYRNNRQHATKCVLCLEQMENASATTCGHLFCWSCILDWMDQKEECPVCRDPIKKSRVVMLKNF